MVDVAVGWVGVSVIDDRPRELLYTHLGGLLLSLETHDTPGGSEVALHAQVASLQADNHLQGSPFEASPAPQVSPARVTTPPQVFLSAQQPQAYRGDPLPAISCTAVVSNMNGDGSLQQRSKQVEHMSLQVS